MKWDRACFCSWFDANEAYGWVWIDTIFGLGQTWIWTKEYKNTITLKQIRNE